MYAKSQSNLDTALCLPSDSLILSLDLYSSTPTSKAQMPPPRLPLPSPKDTTHSASRCTNSVLKRKTKATSKKQSPKKNILSDGRKDENGTRHQGYKLAVVPILRK
jgi:hypothetical protein